MGLRARLACRLTASLAVVSAITAATRPLDVNSTTVALIYVIVILLIATTWGIAESTAAAVLAVLCLNFFFFPPVGTFTITDPQNWVALFVFLATAIIASQLSGRERQRTVEALARERDLERLYALSRALLLSEGGASAPGAIARHIADAFHLPTVGLYDQRTDAVSWAGSMELSAVDVMLRETASSGNTIRSQGGLTVAAIRLGGVPTGSVAIPDPTLSDTVVHSIANLAAIGLERARSQEISSRAEIARQSSELRATILDALAHEFKTPLTAMKAASSDLAANASLPDSARDLAAIIDEGMDGFQALVTDAVQMLRIDAGDFVLHLGRFPLFEVVEAAIHRFDARLDGRRILANVPAGLTVDADRGLLALALRQLLDNAVKYSPPGSTIEVQVSTNGAVEITVRNSGSTIPERELSRAVERFYRGANARSVPGSGLGLSIVQQIAQAHGGQLRFSNWEEGTSVTLTLPQGRSRP
jgi:two-component system, OmpR family, sensor histidine kinase KdpD